MRRTMAIMVACAAVQGCAGNGGKSPEAPPPVSGPPPAAQVPQEEAVWHLRAALNVAALICRQDAAILTGYNRLLTTRRARLALAYADEVRRHGNGPALDRHMTSLYNNFAQPPGMDGFCRAAGVEVGRALATPDDALAVYAPGAIARLEAAKRAPPPTLFAQRPSATETRPAGASDWRIQIGAFTGRTAAEAAWAKARRQAPGLAAYQPRYENVPGRAGLVRLQLAAPQDRASALRLCATAAAGGFDCLPVPRR